MKTRLLLLILLFSTSLLYSQYTRETVFYDDFTNNYNNWPTKSTAYKTHISLSNGWYYFEHFRTSYSWILSKIIDLSEYRDFEIEARIQKISGIQNNGFGIVWGRKDSDNQFDFYISANGYYKINKSAYGTRHKMVPWTKTSYINQGNGATNKLTIRKTGNIIKFYVNDNYLNQLTFESFFGNRIGFVVYKNQKIAIDYLRVSYLKKEEYNYPPEITITEPDISRGFNVIEAETMRIAGIAKDNDGIYTVMANGVKANLQTGGYFSAYIPVSTGENTINVVATDMKMKSATKSFVVKRKSVNNVNNFPVNEKRVALIFGNSNYTGAANLGSNPINDARDIATTLKGIGFDVMLKTNANLNTMNDAIREFGRKNRDADVALFYFAGHGMQVERVNYLLPVGVNIRDKNDVSFECVSVETVQKIMETSNSNRLNLIVLDACRNNPFRTWQRGGKNGLADMTPPSGTLIAFSTSPGSVAANGTGRNGLYTGELIKQLAIPQRIEDVFINTRIQVEKKSGGQQSPWELARLRGKYFLVK